MSSPAKSTPRNLERVRINQQRSRDRKRAYTAELERRVEQLEQALDDANKSNGAGYGNQPSSSSDANEARWPNSADAILARLTHANHVRAELLRVLGIDTETQDRFIRTAPVQAESSPSHLAMNDDDEARPTLSTQTQQRHDPSREVTFDFTVPYGQFDALTDLQITRPAAPDFEPDFSTPAGPLLESPSSPMPSSLPLCSNCSIGTSESIPSSPSDSTTACSIAFSMVFSNNKRGYRFNDLEARMRTGYQKSPGQECRILNKVLFDVLAEIT